MLKKSNFENLGATAACPAVFFQEFILRTAGQASSGTPFSIRTHVEAISRRLDKPAVAPLFQSETMWKQSVEGWTSQQWHPFFNQNPCGSNQ
ncbi:MAG: hypothetical protein ABSG67_02590 [Thermoguttaceae bacterium]|jgi:hypothetical protein